MTSLPHPTRPVKTCDFYSLHSADNLLTLEIVGRRQMWYRLTPLASDFGTAFRLNATAGLKLAAGEESYDVLLDGRNSSCTCPGHTYTGGCKHLSALLALQAEGKLGAPAPKPATAPCVLDDL